MSSLNKQFRTFSECNDFIFNVIKDERDFLVDGVCILKVIQIGIKVNYTWRSLLDLHPILEVTKRWVTLQRSKHLIQARDLILDRSIIAVDLNRSNKALNSKHLGRYFKSLERSDFLRFVQASSDKSLSSDATKTPDTQGVSYNRKEAVYARKVYKRIAFLCKKNKELEPFKASLMRAAQLYLDQWVTWKKILINTSVETCLLVCHYHNEGIIHACQDVGVKVIEVQHGVIMKSSVFYVYPKILRTILSASLFPDEIHVFGEYWRDKLCMGGEFSPTQIRIVGDIVGEGKKVADPESDPPATRTLLVTSQAGMASHIESYLSWLIMDCEEKNITYSIVIKTHPNESGNEYDFLVDEFEPVIKSNRPVSELMSQATDHLSVFSMTMFSAAAMKVKNYSIYVDSRSDFINEMVQDGVTEVVEKGINIFTMEIGPQSCDENIFFSPVVTNVELWKRK